MRLHTLTVFSDQVTSRENREQIHTATLQVISLRLMTVVIWTFVYTSTSYTLVGLNYASIIYQGLTLVFWPTVVPALSCRSSRFSPLLMTFSRFCRAIPDTCGMTCHYALCTSTLYAHTHHALTHAHTNTHACIQARTHTHTALHTSTHSPTHPHAHTHKLTSSVFFFMSVSLSVSLGSLQQIMKTSHPLLASLAPRPSLPWSSITSSTYGDEGSGDLATCSDVSSIFHL